MRPRAPRARGGGPALAAHRHRRRRTRCALSLRRRGARRDGARARCSATSSRRSSATARRLPRSSARRRRRAPASVECAAVVNAAGLAADRVAALAGVDVDAAGYRQHPCKGDYFALAPAAPLRFAGLVYPVHGAAGLGVHVTLDLGGRVRFGPDARVRRRASTTRRPRQGRGASPRPPAATCPGCAPSGSRPTRPASARSCRRRAQPFRDFVIAEESARGLPGLVNLVGIESPGLTAALAIAERVAGLLALTLTARAPHTATLSPERWRRWASSARSARARATTSARARGRSRRRRRTASATARGGARRRRCRAR